MLFTDPLTKTNIFQFPVITRQLVANFLLVGLAAVLVSLRFLARRVRRLPIWWDDIAAVVSLVLTSGVLGMHVSYANHGMGYHITELPLANITFIAKQLVAYQIVYIAAICSVKLSYLFFYQRTFPTPEFRKWVWICMGIVLAYWSGCMLQAFLICRPFEMNWNPTIPGGHCANYNVAFATTGVLNAITDLIIMAFPTPLISRLHLATGAKVGLIAIFAIGLFVTGVSIIRITVLLNVNFSDLPYTMHDAAFWSVVEPAVAIINCCIPLLRPLLRAISPGGVWSSIKGSIHIRGESQEDRSRIQKKTSIQFDEYPLTRIEDEAERC
ncbi:hypothetical protein E8E13_009303 [Curvularia kusanoi]|uniref:Rhodopsin domain-containing protein n=1 Tax=Curvularia kusanoi TaxID=90978 RepID=A0A9P4TF60_CURKU|nr:hypothetical protein E8E13_009303 [Curvularia kusanoi]